MHRCICGDAQKIKIKLFWNIFSVQRFTQDSYDFYVPHASIELCKESDNDF